VGYIQHDAVIVVTYREEVSRDLAALRESVAEPSLARHIVGPIPASNGYETWIFTPDGSKEGWEQSDRADELRGRFEQIATDGRGDVVHVRFGGDYGHEIGARIVSSTDGAWVDAHLLTHK
jgi:hypothetical protein